MTASYRSGPNKNKPHNYNRSLGTTSLYRLGTNKQYDYNRDLIIIIDSAISIGPSGRLRHTAQALIKIISAISIGPSPTVSRSGPNNNSMIIIGPSGTTASYHSGPNDGTQCHCLGGRGGREARGF